MADEIIPKEEVAIEAPIEPFNNESQDILPISEPVQAPEPQTAQIPVSEPLATTAESPSEIKTEPIAEVISEETKPIETKIQSEPTPEPIPKIVTEEVKPEISEPIKPESKPAEQISEIKSEPVSEPIKTELKPPEPIPEVKIEPKQEPEPKPIPEVIPAVAVILKSKTLARELLVKARNMIQFRKRKKLEKVMTLFLKKQKITNDEVEKFMHVSDATATRYLSQLEKEGKIKQSGKTGKSVFYTLVK
jgi:hypothetical protein